MSNTRKDSGWSHDLLNEIVPSAFIKGNQADDLFLDVLKGFFVMKSLDPIRLLRISVAILSVFIFWEPPQGGIFLFSGTKIQRGMETPLDVLSRAASLVHADDEKPFVETAPARPRSVFRSGYQQFEVTLNLEFSITLELSSKVSDWMNMSVGSEKTQVFDTDKSLGLENEEYGLSLLLRNSV
ncbi:hypothetical protein AAES_19921 [Amazona aestiva]|uniref:Uncharacterized protein n=1 Tax=Amazona aestiva TaxID=12930 RepID=A0A0Q3X8X7_AMAAE|nr:hypothetical protein AAES_19921 [Amazona aestiva]